MLSSAHQIAIRCRGLPWLAIVVFVAASVSVGSGCRSNKWCGARLAVPRDANRRMDLNPFDDQDDCENPSRLQCAEEAYSRAVERDLADDQRCFDDYAEVVSRLWPDVESQLAGIEPCDERTWSLYHASVSGIVFAGQRYGRLAIQDLATAGCANDRRMDVRYHGFVWHESDFDELKPVGDYTDEELNTIYIEGGVGIPLLVLRKNDNGDPMIRDETHFAATAIVRPAIDEAAGGTGLALELYDPLRVSRVSLRNGRDAKLYRDISAPLAYYVQLSEPDGYLGFLQPGNSQRDAGLFMIEPYQPGKIPLVFVHGLLSDPTTWITMANELRARPELMERYQLWAFQYPTGNAFVRSAADLRDQLKCARQLLDPEGLDPALSNMVLVGHSMGGLLSKLQITASETRLWDAVANCPFDSIVANEQQRFELARYFFFEPVPSVKRVVYIGTPHRGSAWASRTVGQIGAILVSQPAELKAQHEELRRQNPGVFTEEVQDRIPTSVDLMNPSSSLLAAIDRLPRARDVHVHSIYGTGRRMLLDGPADGVVPVSSAQQNGVETERIEPLKHSELHRSDDVISEVICILKMHLDASTRDSVGYAVQEPIRAD